MSGSSSSLNMTTNRKKCDMSFYSRRVTVTSFLLWDINLAQVSLDKLICFLHRVS